MKFEAPQWNIPADAQLIIGRTRFTSRAQVEAGIAVRVSSMSLVIVNDNRTCIIAGKKDECAALIKHLSCKAGKIHQAMVGHCEVVAPLQKSVGNIHGMLEVPRGKLARGVELFTCVGNVPLRNMRHQSLSDNIGALYTEVADFSKIVTTVADKGYDVFVELGAGDLRTAAIGNILEGRRHLAVAIDRKGMNPWSQVMRMLAKLIGNGVPAHVSQLYHRDLLIPPPVKKNRLRRDIPLNAYFESTKSPKDIAAQFRNIIAAPMRRVHGERGTSSAVTSASARQGAASAVNSNPPSRGMVSRSPCPTLEPGQFMKWGMPRSRSQVVAPAGGRRSSVWVCPGSAAQDAFLPFPGNPADNNHTPGELPLGWYNLTEFTTNRTSKCLGMEFARLTNLRLLRCHLIFSWSRVLEVTGMRKAPWCRLQPREGYDDRRI